MREIRDADVVDIRHALGCALWEDGKHTGLIVKLTNTDCRFHGNMPDDIEAEVLRMFADLALQKSNGTER